MQCPDCRRENRAAARFCEECGAALTLKCRECGAAIRPSARFCDACGHPRVDASLEASAVQVPVEDRRLVTVLFADLVGFTSIAEKLDAEPLRTIQSLYFDRMAEEIARFEGTIEKYAGDAILALFGAPTAHEDDPLRAVRCALAMQEALHTVAIEARERWDIDLTLRVGINTGEVVSGMWNVGSRKEYSVSGDAINIAARLQTAAASGEVVVAESTHRLVRDFVVWTSIGSLTMKGKSQLVTAHRAVAMRNVKDRVDATGRLTPFVGRERELSVLGGCFDLAIHGEGQVVFLSGEPGMGKSRLLLEFRRQTSFVQSTWLEGHCISYGRNVPYLPIIDLVKRAFSVEDTDSDEQISEKIDRSALEWESGARETVPYLKYLLGVDPGDPAILAMDPVRRQVGIFEGLRALVLTTGRVRPLVLLIEDVHWVDTESEKALARIADLIVAAPVLLIATYRPGHAISLGERSYDTRLPLPHLPAGDSAVLAEAVLTVDSLPTEVQSLLTRKAEGNPLYIEELARSLVEIGVLARKNGSYEIASQVDLITVPATIQEIILSRIDRLDRDAKTAIQLGAVIGREFTLRLLQHISNRQAKLEGALNDLLSLELIRETGYFLEPAYVFKHALTQDVAYSTVLKERRKALHQAVAAAVEQLYADRLPDQFEVLAYHYLQAEDWLPALEFSVKAAEKAVASYANAEAIASYRSALVATEHLTAQSIELLTTIYGGLGQAHYALNAWAEGVAAFIQMGQIARAERSPHHEGLALCGAAYGCLFSHQFDRAEQLVEEALTLSRTANDPAVEGGALNVLGTLNALRGRLATALEQVEQAIPHLQATGQSLAEGQARGVVSLIQAWQGNYDAALAAADWAVSLVEQNAATVALVDVIWVQGLGLMAQGRYYDALDILNRTLEVCRRMGNQSFEGRIVNSIGWIHGELGDWDEAIRLNRASLQLGMAVGDPEIIANCRANLADYALAQGNTGDARRELESLYAALPAAHEWMKWRYSQHVMHSLGTVMLREGDNEGSLRLADECLQLAEATLSRKNIVKARRLRGRATSSFVTSLRDRVGTA